MYIFYKSSFIVSFISFFHSYYSYIYYISNPQTPNNPQTKEPHKVSNKIKIKVSTQN